MRNICIHKGLLFARFPEEFGRCADVGRAAARYPDMNFIIYHSGYEAGTTEGPYDPENATRGADTLIKSVEANGIGRNANVYAELGSTWRFICQPEFFLRRFPFRRKTHRTNNAHSPSAARAI